MQPSRQFTKPPEEPRHYTEEEAPDWCTHCGQGIIQDKGHWKTKPFYTDSGRDCHMSPNEDHEPDRG
jgi:hypothetical protein